MQIVMAGFNVVDGFVAALLLFGLASGLKRGLSGEMATLAATIVSGLAAWKLSGWVRELILKNSDLTAKEATVAGVVAVFVVVYVVLWIIRKSLAALMQFNFKGKAERFGGAFSGLLRYSIFAICVLLLATFIPNDTVQKAVGEESVFGHFVYQRVRPLYEDLSKKHGIPLPPGPGDINIPPSKTAPQKGAPRQNAPPPIRDVDAAPPDVLTNEVPAGMPLGPLK